MAIKPITVDFETEAIENRPVYPPKPTSVSIMYETGKPKYLSWGHPTKNNCTKEQAQRELADVWRSGKPLLFQNGKFDVDVGEVHLDLPIPSWERIHDTLYLLFLFDPHARQLALKPAAAELLNMPADEQNAVYDWLAEQGIIKRSKKKGGVGFSYQKDAGAYICRAPGDIVGKYANGDTLRTRKLFDYLYPIIVDNGMLEAYDRERQLMPIMLRNEREGVHVDLNLLRRDVAHFTRQQEIADAWLRKRLKVGPSLNLDSNEELADALEAAGAASGFLMTPTGARSTAKESLLQAIDDNKIFQVLQYRSKLGTQLGTFMRPWLITAETTGGLIHTHWNQVRSPAGKDSVGTRTGRFSSSPNFQNIPNDLDEDDDDYEHPKFAKVDELPLVKKYIVADRKSDIILDRDFSQQELRILAHFEDGQLCQAYNDNPLLDVHDFVGEEVQRVAQRVIIRKHIKILNFLQVYGGGIDALCKKLKCDPSAAREIKNFHSAALPDVKELDKLIKQIGKNGDSIRTWGGRRYFAEEPKMINNRWQTFEYKLLNYLIQGSAADHTKQAIINYDHVRRDGRFMLSVHDEMLANVHKSKAKSEMKLLKEAMESVPFDVPITSDGEAGYSWGALVKFA